MMRNIRHRYLEFIAYFFTAIGFLVMVIFILKLSSAYCIGGNFTDEEMAITGQVGDFMGGVIGSIWALAGVFLYFSAIKMQNNELENQSKFRKEDAIMDSLKDFEKTFFSLLLIQQRIKEGLSAEFSNAKWENKHHLVEVKTKCSGNDFFYEAHIVLKKLYAFCQRDKYLLNLHPDIELPYAKDSNAQKMLFKAYDEDLAVSNMGFYEALFEKVKNQPDELSRCKAIYFLFFTHYSSTIGHYCRHLYNILKYMDQTQLDIIVMVRNNFSKEERKGKIQNILTRFKRYSAFLQSEISSSEMCILFYNSLIYPKARKLYLRYNLLENLQDIHLIKYEHKNMISGFQCKSPDKMIYEFLS